MDKWTKKVPYKPPPVNLPLLIFSNFNTCFCVEAKMSNYSTDISLLRCKCGIKHEGRTGGHISFKHTEIEEVELMHFIHAAM